MKRRLRLRAETIRVLSGAQLRMAGGGQVWTTNDGICPSTTKCPPEETESCVSVQRCGTARAKTDS